MQMATSFSVHVHTERHEPGATGVADAAITIIHACMCMLLMKMDQEPNFRVCNYGQSMGKAKFRALLHFGNGL